MRSTRRQHARTRWVGAFMVALVACADHPTSTEERDVPDVAASLSGATPRTTLEFIGTGMAIALRDAATRAWLLQAFEQSPYVEHRIPLRRVISADTSSTVRGILRRASRSFTEAELAQLPDLELYLPIPAHQAAAKTASTIQVAVRSAADSFFIVRADGSAYRVSENYDPGSTVTVVIGRSEIDYDDLESALIGGSRTGSMMLARQRANAPTRRKSTGLLPLTPTGAVPHAECDPEIQNCGGGGGGTPPPPPSGGNTAQKTYVTMFALEQNMEGLLLGTNEVEVLGKVNGAYDGCASATNLYADIEYVWSISAGHRAATAIPIGTSRFTLRAFEDDDDRCIERDSDDPLGNFNTGLLITQYNFGWWTDSPGLAWMVIGAAP